MILRRMWLPILLVLPMILLVACGGSSDNKTATPVPQAQAGKITAVASGITGQNGKTYAVAAYDYDWAPGAAGPAIGGAMGIINSDNFSFSEVLRTVDQGGNFTLTAEEKTFGPGTYSVVFYVSEQGKPPQYFAEKRVTVNGDVTATAQKWSDWTHQ